MSIFNLWTVKKTMISSVRTQIWLNFAQLPNNEWVYDTNVMTTTQETGGGDSERPFSSPGTTRSKEWRHSFWDFRKHIGQKLTEEEKKHLRQTASYSLLLLHSSHEREHSCSIASRGKKIKGRQCSRHAVLLIDSMSWAVWSTSLVYHWIVIHQILEKKAWKDKSAMIRRCLPHLYFWH